MKFGVNTFIWTANFDARNLPLAARSSKRAVSMASRSPMFRPAEFASADITQGSRARTSLECTICSVLTGGLSMISDDAAVRQKTRDAHGRLRQDGGRGRREDHRRTAVFAGRLPARAAAYGGRVEVGGRLLSVARPGALAARRHHRHRAAESLRDLLPQYGGRRRRALRSDRSSERRHSVRHVPRQYRGEGHRAGYRTVGRHLKHVHTCENDRGIPGTGHVEWKSVFQALRDLNYDGWLTIESFGFALGELSAAASIWRDIAPTPESIAFEGVKFLKKTLLAIKGRWAQAYLRPYPPRRTGLTL